MTEALHPGIDSVDHELLSEFVTTLSDEIAELHELARTLDRRLRPAEPDEPAAHAEPGRDLAAVLQDAERASAELTRLLAHARAIVADFSSP